jgi:RNA polymerase sigma factor (sigma-70 family)
LQNNSNDKAIQFWNGVLAGDTIAFNGLMTEFYAELYKYGYSLCEDAEVVKDSIQNVFLTIWKNRASLKQIDYVKFYLLKSLRREINRLAQKDALLSTYNETFSQTTEQTESDTAEHLVRNEDEQAISKKVQEIMVGLPKRQQEIIYLRYYMELKQEQIAEMIGINRQSVYNLLHDALKRFKEKL